MATVEKAVFVKNDGKYIHPETCASVVYYDEEHTITMKEKIDEILEAMEGMSYVQISIGTFTAKPSTIERGNVITSVTFNATFNKAPRIISIIISGVRYVIDDIQNYISINEESGYNFSYTISDILINGQTECKIEIEDNKRGSATKTTTISKSNRYYYGAANSFPGLTNLNNYLSTSKSKTVNMTIQGDNNHAYYCFPITSINNTVKFVHSNFDVTNVFAVKGITYLETEYNPSTKTIKYTSNGEIINNFTSENIINTNMDNDYKTKTTYIIYESTATYDNDIIGFIIQ